MMNKNAYGTSRNTVDSLTDFVGREVGGELSERVGVDLERLSAAARRARNHLDSSTPDIVLGQIQRRELRRLHAQTAAAARRPTDSRHCRDAADTGHWLHPLGSAIPVDASR